MQLKSILLYVPDVAAAAAFYSEAFGLEIAMLSPDGQYAQMVSGETAIGFGVETAIEALNLPMTVARRANDAGPVQLAFETDDVHSAFARVVAAGGTVLNEPSERPWGQVVGHVRDLNGFVVEIGSLQSEDWEDGQS